MAEETQSQIAAHVPVRDAGIVIDGTANRKPKLLVKADGMGLCPQHGSRDAGAGLQHRDRRPDQRRAMARAPDDPQARLAASGKAYVLFAAEHPAHFEVMFHPGLLQRDDAALRAAERAAGAVLREAIAAVRGGTGSGPPGRPDLELEALKAWTHAHGLATLWVNGNLSPEMAPGGIAALADRVFGICDT